MVDAENDRLRDSKGKNHGVRVYAVPKLRAGVKKWPTRADWIERKNAKYTPPEEQKMIDHAAASEERARRKLAELGFALEEESS